MYKCEIGITTLFPCSFLNYQNTLKEMRVGVFEEISAKIYNR